MLIVAIQDNVDCLYAIYNTVTDRFLGVNLTYNECVGKVMDYDKGSYEVAKSRVDHPQHFKDIVDCLYIDDMDRTDKEVIRFHSSQVLSCDTTDDVVTIKLYKGEQK